jgi:hypothetical protein
MRHLVVLSLARYPWLEGNDMTTSPAQPAQADTSPGRRALPGLAGDPALRRWLRLLPASAGICYVAAWAAGLASWPANLALNATNAQVAASYRAHPAGAASQYLLSEGLAGLLLGMVLAAALIPNRDRGPARPWPAAATAAGAVAISLLQAVIGMFLIASATHHDIARAGGLSDLVNRLDGAKMLALAAVAAYLSARRTRDRRPPNWLRATDALAAAALAVSGLDYLLLANSLAWTVYISGPLLLAWIAATGIWLTRSSPDGSAGTPT